MAAPAIKVSGRGMETSNKLGAGLQAGVAFRGADEMWRQLGELTGSLQRKYIRDAIRKGGAVLVKEMKQRAPRSSRTGSAAKHSLKTSTKLYSNASARKKGTDKKGNPIPLWKSIKQIPSSKWKSASAQARAGNIATAVGPQWPEGAHAHLLEFGHKLVAWGRATGKTVPARPWMRPAIAAAKPTILAVQNSAIRAGLEKEAAKMRAKVDAGK